MSENNNFEIVHIHELPSFFNREVKVDEEMIKKCTLGYLVVLQHKENNETVGLHVSIRYITPDNNVLMQEGATIVVKIEDWNNMPHEEKTLRESPSVRLLVEYGLSFVSGMIFTRASGTVMNNIFVPHMATSIIMNDIVIENLGQKT